MSSSPFQLNEAGPDTIALSGALTFDNAAQVLSEGAAALARGQQSRLDLSSLDTADSAGLACVLALMAEARERGRSLDVVHAPAGLMALARVCEVDQLLG